jgi:hypothetical protein
MRSCPKFGETEFGRNAAPDTAGDGLQSLSAVPIRRGRVAQYWPPAPPRGHCECRMEVFVSLLGFSTDQ